MQFPYFNKPIFGVLFFVLILPGINDTNAQTLPTESGEVLFWLDASRQAELWQRQATRVPPVTSEPAELFLDSSGNRTHFVQRNPDSRPRLREISGFQFFDFDGIDDYMTCSTQTDPLSTTSLYLLAAPRSNPGAFRALFSSAKLGVNDYQSGLNVDQTGLASSQLEFINVEGLGFQGSQDLLKESYPFGQFHLFEVHISRDQVQVIVDGKLPGVSRPRQSTGQRFNTIHVEELFLGSRIYSNSSRNPIVRGFFDGAIAELALTQTSLPEEKRKSIRKYFLEKYANLKSLPLRGTGSGERGYRVERVKNPPAVQMLVPGFDVYELPIKLTNINNVLYRSDGTLVALAYDGNIYHLIDTNNDGLEDSAKLFWRNNGQINAPIGMDLTPAGYRLGSGVAVACKGKCTLIIDSDNDDIADKEIVVADGWKQLDHGVDALGVAFEHRDHSLYFGLGTAQYTNPYLKNSKGTATYTLNDERGTILRIAPDLKSREVIATGIRFPVALRFNRSGDLFCTDQEGATWLANGNPLDELLHVKRKRHYGFPPRHPKHLPQVIDEPSVMDYGPQHQSVCGLNFNRSPNSQKHFGPDFWKDNALLTGYSRGKIYRTELTSTGTGYVARNQLIGVLQMLPADCCISPNGALVVACHSGGPDWGSGPKGNGKLFKIVYGDRIDTPQPVLVSSSGNNELMIDFDRPLSTDQLLRVHGRTLVEAGISLRAGDRFEYLRPGYAVVQKQSTEKRYRVPVDNVQVSTDRTSLIIRLSKKLGDSQYAVTVKDFAVPTRSDSSSQPKLKQNHDLEIDCSLSGVSCTLFADSADQQPARSGPRSITLPSLDTDVSRSLTIASERYRQFWKEYEQARAVELTTQLDLSHMLNPRVQPGSKLDFEYSPETIFLRLVSSSPFQADLGGQSVQGVKDDQEFVCTLKVDAPKTLVPLKIRITPAVRSDHSTIYLRASWSTNRDSNQRPFALERMKLPWLENRLGQGSEDRDAVRPTELATSSWGRGKQIFHGTRAQCFRCHQVHGKGGSAGPDLSNLVHRDYQSVLRDIIDPNAALHPDHLTYLVELTDGRALSGAIQNKTDHILLFDKDGKATRVETAEIETMQPTGKSLMPTGLQETLNPSELNDLIAFLLLPPPSMPRDLKNRPPPRTKKEVDQILANSKTDIETRPLQILLVAGKKDHGPGEHDYPAWLDMWSQLLESSDKTKVTKCMEWPNSKQLEQADVMVLFQQGTWNADRARDVDRFLERGGGISLIHYAVDGGKQSPDFARRIGLAWQGGLSRFRHGALDVRFEKNHPITRNLSKVHFLDESYWKLQGDPKKISILGNGLEENAWQPLFWAHQESKGRVFVSILGHYSWTFDDPIFRILLLRGMAWTAREPVDRFNELVWPGADILPSE